MGKFRTQGYQARASKVFYVIVLLALTSSTCMAWSWRKSKPKAAVEPIAKSQEEEFIGWKGEVAGAADLATVDAPAPSDVRPWIETLSWQPRAFLYHNFITPGECDHLIGLAKPFMERSGVVDSDTGKIIESQERTSSGVFLDREQDDVIAAIERKIADYTKLPLENGEPFHILRYQDGEQYRPHYDYFFDDIHVKNGGQRVATVLIYLTDVEEGGETVFPDSVYKHPEDKLHHYSSCGQAGLAAKPKRGDALLFYSLTPDGEKDQYSLHAGCPVTKGVKFSATKWIRVGKHEVWDGYKAKKEELDKGN